MEYNHEKKCFLCFKCGPGARKWKNVFSQVLVEEETGDCYCIVHREEKIGNSKMVPEWGNNA